MKKFLSLFVAALLGATAYTDAAKVYFVNAEKWAAVNAYMWADGDKKNANWPGVAMTKTEDKAHEFDVYSYEVPDGFSNLLFNNGDKSQTFDLTFDAAKPYYFNCKWYATLDDVKAAPAEVEKVKLYFVNKDGWTKVQAYVFERSGYKAWPGEEMTKTGEKALEKDIYSYEFPTFFTSIIFNNKEGESGSQTKDLTWDKAKPYYYDGTWFATKEDIKDIVKDPVVQIAGTWTEKKWELKDLTLAADKETATYEVTLEAKSYEFKIKKDGKWVTKSNGGKPYELKRDWPGVKDVKDDATENLKLIADVAGKYVFTWTFEGDSLGITFPAEAPAVKGFYVTGDSAFVVDAGLAAAKEWEPDAIRYEKDTLELNLKANQEYALKVTLDGKWTNGMIKGFSDLTETAKGLYSDKDNNICFFLKEAGKIRIIYFVENGITTFKLEGAFDESKELVNGYYLIGPKGWEIASIDPEQKFAETENAGEYSLEITLVADQEIKVVEVKDNAIAKWYPDGLGTAYKVDAEHAGKIKIYFKPAGSEDEDWKTFIDGGFFFIPSRLHTTAEHGNVITQQIEGNTYTLTARPNYGYHFSQWSDGNIDNPRSITLTQDTTFAALFAPNKYNINVSCDKTYGTIKGENGSFEYLSTQTYEAVPNYGYHFNYWSDENVQNPRTITIERDITISAIFTPNYYQIQDNSDRKQGYISSDQYYAYLSQAQISAIPNRGYHFVKWADGIKENPRTITITQDTTFEAIFDYILSGNCGANNVLSWSFTPATMALDITGKGALSDNFTYGQFIQSVTIGNEVSVIGQSAFSDCSNLTNVLLGTAVKVIESSAFSGCNAIQTITCYSQRPPTVNSNAFGNLPYSTIIYVPADYLNTYTMHDFWGIYDVRPLGAETVSTTELVVEPTPTTADIVWPSVSGAATYELVIKDKNGNIICTLIFSANGQLTQIAFAAPSRDRSQKQAQVAGFSFTVTGLEGGTEYDLIITAKDSNGNTLDTKQTSFTTPAKITTSIDQITNGQSSNRKFIKDGQLFILRDGKVYNALGAEVR